MNISRELALKIFKYLDEHKDFYFPFSVMSQRCTSKENDFIEIDPSEWHIIEVDANYKNFRLCENLQDLGEDTTKLLAKGFIEHITSQSLEKYIFDLAKNCRSKWKSQLCESEKIEEYGLNEFIGGKADAYEECLYLIKKYQGIPAGENSIFIEYGAEQ